MDESMFQSTNKTEEAQVSSQENTQQSAPQIIVVHDAYGTRARHAWWWVVLGIAAVCAVIVAIWMTSVSGTLSHVQSAVVANSDALSAQQAHLSAISQMLAGISQSLSNLSREMASFFTTVIGLLSRHWQ